MVQGILQGEPAPRGMKRGEVDERAGIYIGVVGVIDSSTSSSRAVRMRRRCLSDS